MLDTPYEPRSSLSNDFHIKIVTKTDDCAVHALVLTAAGHCSDQDSQEAEIARS